jgi:hypothetical protein
MLEKLYKFHPKIITNYNLLKNALTHRSLVGSMVIDAEFNKEDHGSIPTTTTWKELELRT